MDGPENCDLNHLGGKRPVILRERLVDGMKKAMQIGEFRDSLGQETPPEGLTAPLEALWWDAKGDWARAHGLVDDLATPEGMAVHAYLHRKEGVEWNADYWYGRAGRRFHRATLEEEWAALVEGLPG